MSFKDHVESDIDRIFMNLAEFAETHIINEKKYVCIVQDVISNDDLTINRTGEYYPVIYGEAKTINIPKKSLPQVPVYGQRLWVDGAIYTVASVADDMGMLTIVVEGDGR